MILSGLKINMDGMISKTDSLLRKAAADFIYKRIRRNEPLKSCFKKIYASFGYKVINFKKPDIQLRMDGSPRLYIDVSNIIVTDSGSGIQRVTREISAGLNSILIEGKKAEFVYTSIGRSGFYKAVMSGENGKLKFSASNEPALWGCQDSLLALDYAPSIILSQINYIKALSEKGVKIYFILHDLLPALHPEWFASGDSHIQKAWLREVCKTGKIICASQAVKAELIKWSVKNKIKLHKEPGWFHSGCSLETFSENDERLPSLPKPPLFLMVGTVEPRKAHAQALEAFTLLWREGVEAALVIAGKKGWLISEVWESVRSHPEYNKRLFWFDNGISDALLGALYRKADAVIMASHAEGFGLPVMEGARHKAPLILRDIPVFRETAGENAFYFSGEGGDDLARALKKWLELWKVSRHPASSAIKINSWPESAAQILTEMGALQDC